MTRARSAVHARGWTAFSLAALTSACAGPGLIAERSTPALRPTSTEPRPALEVAGRFAGTPALGLATQEEPSGSTPKEEPIARVESDQGDLAKASQNPIGNMASLPFENATSFGLGPDDAVANVLNIQPVYPVSVGRDWNLINRAIVPLIYQEELIPGTESASGLGDISYTGFFSPAKPGKLIWGVGPSFLFPTATDDRFASDKFSAGAGVVALTMPANWVLGVLAQNVWSVAGDADAADVNFLLLQPIINYNLDDGWYLTSVPVLTANWEAESSNRWTVPVGGGVGKITRWGNQAVDLAIQAFYNVERPEAGIAQIPNIGNQGDTWTVELKLKLLFPK